MICQPMLLSCIKTAEENTSVNKVNKLNNSLYIASNLTQLLFCHSPSCGIDDLMIFQAILKLLINDFTCCFMSGSTNEKEKIKFKDYFFAMKKYLIHQNIRQIHNNLPIIS